MSPRTVLRPGSRCVWLAGSAILLLIAVVLASLAGCGSQDRSLVLVTVAGLRADKVNAELTPEWAALAGTGRSLESLRTPSPQTVPALAALMTGEDPDRLGARFGDLTRLPPTATTLAERFRERGYQTTAMVGQGRIARVTGLGRGFEEFISPSGPLRQAILPDERQRLRPRQSGLWTAQNLSELVGRHLREQTLQERFFLWVHLGDLSQLGAVDDPQEAYRAQLDRVDALMGDLQDALMTYGLAERVVLAATSVHGMSLGQVGEIGSGLSLDEDVIRLPAFVHGPGVDGAPPGLVEAKSLSRLGDRLLALVEQPGPSGGESASFFAETRLPERQYGWPPRALVRGDAGTLRLSGTARWQPADGSAELIGPEAWETAPAELRERLASAGYAPSGSDLEAPPPETRARILQSVARAHRLIDQGEIAEALEILAGAIDMAPEAPGVRHAFLMSYTALPRAERQAPELSRLKRESLEVLERLSEQDLPRTIDLARDLVRLGRCDRALARIGDAASLAELPGEQLALASVEASCEAYESAVARIEGVIDGEEGPAPELQEWRGDLLAMSGNAFRAKQAYEKVLAAPGGESAQLLAKLGDQLAELGESDEALQRYAKATQLDGSYRYPHARAADVLLEKGQTGAAAHAAVLSIPKTGKPVTDALNRARELRRRGLFEAARLELRKGLEQSPSDPRLELALVRVLREEGKLDDARSRLSRLEQRMRTDPRVLIERARVEALSGNDQLAAEYLSRAQPHSGPMEARHVRSDPIFVQEGSKALAELAAGFEGQLKPAPSKEEGDGR